MPPPPITIGSETTRHARYVSPRAACVENPRRALVLFAALAVAACTVGPDFHPPAVDVPATWKDPSANTAGGSVTPHADPDPRWWRAFNDPTLDSLIDRAAAGNISFQQTIYRIAEARAQEQAQRAAGLPSLKGTGGYTREKLGATGIFAGGGIAQTGAASELGAISSLTQPIDFYQAGFDASWELDLFGKIRRSVEQAGAQTQEQIENRNDSLVSLEAEVARTYLQLRANQALLRTTHDAAQAQADTLRITQVRRRQGLASQLDVDQALSRLTQTQSQLPQFQQQAEQSMNTLAVLTGQQPGALDTELATEHPIPSIPPGIPISLPATLVRRRPDIRNAEATLHAATANIGIAVAQLYPDISLSGEVGRSALQFGALSNWSSTFYQFGPNISLPIFQGGQLRANVRLANAQQAEAALGYRQTVLSALQDVENNLVALRNDRARQRSLDQSVTIANNQLAVAQDRYRNGLAAFLDVLDAETTFINAQQDAIRGRLQLALDVAALYKAIGGGWQIAASS
jgi:NodT family efflux transporter outer membrane factor (OMF) lipoprotein